APPRRRAPRGGGEPVRQELKLRDGVLAESRLPAGPDIGRDLLTVHVQLELPGLAAVSVWQRRRRVDCERLAPGRKQGEPYPIAPVHREFLDLARIDVAAEARGG